MPNEHTVKQGDCISSIADKYGFLPDTIWNDSANAVLKQERRDPNVLFPGDVVVIPDRHLKEESGATEQCHRFRKKGAPAKLKVRLTINDEPRANVPYKLMIDGNWIDGTTDGDGFIDESLAPGSKKGTLVVGEGDSQNVFEFSLGTVDPLETEEGVKSRLRDLGYNVDDDFPGELRAFQTKEGLESTGEVDEATRSKLKDRFGQ